MCCASCALFVWCKLEPIDRGCRAGFPPSESAQNARPDPTHPADCARAYCADLDGPNRETKNGCAAAKGSDGHCG